jgi:hypothetical protein
LQRSQPVLQQGIWMDTKVDFLIGAGPIAEFMFGKNTKENRRKVYYRACKLEKG